MHAVMSENLWRRSDEEIDPPGLLLIISGTEIRFTDKLSHHIWY